jgi:peptidoglycan/LPS O-acetylase OafA/YrhL
VDLFFVLSAFLLSMPFLRQAAGDKPVSVRRYFGRRALRILPLYYAAVLVATALLASSPGDLFRAVPYLFFLNFAALATPLFPYSGAWWSLATEAQFYLVLPLLSLALASRRGRVGGLVALGLWGVAYGAYLTRKLFTSNLAGEIALGSSLLGRAPLFLVGVAAAWLFLHRGPALHRRMMRAALWRNGGADVVFLAILTALTYLFRWAIRLGTAATALPPYQAWHVIEAPLWAIVLLLLLLAPLRLKPALFNRVLNRLGVISYSIYILHLPLIVFGFRALDHLLPFSEWTPDTAFIARLGCALLICLACIALAELTYRAIELPFLRRKESLRA